MGKLGNQVGTAARLNDGIEDRQAWAEGYEGFVDDISALACNKIDWLNFTKKKQVMEIGLNFIIGAGAILYGLYTLVTRQVTPQKMTKLQSLKQSHGEKMGLSIHIIGYTVVPIVAGALMLLAHFRAL